MPSRKNPPTRKSPPITTPPGGGPGPEPIDPLPDDLHVVLGAASPEEIAACGLRNGMTARQQYDAIKAHRVVSDA